MPGGSGEAGWSARTLREVNPYYWGSQFTDDGTWPDSEIHSS
ncbi:hypothetical protein [Microbispora sp. H13382]|nr:hypothetical protein [Microbispora sp. H13382]